MVLVYGLPTSLVLVYGLPTSRVFVYGLAKSRFFVYGLPTAAQSSVQSHLRQLSYSLFFFNF